MGGWVERPWMGCLLQWKEILLARIVWFESCFFSSTHPISCVFAHKVIQILFPFNHENLLGIKTSIFQNFFLSHCNTYYPLRVCNCHGIDPIKTINYYYEILRWIYPSTFASATLQGRNELEDIRIGMT